MAPERAIEVFVDGSPVAVTPGTNVLEACDQAGVYVPRLCSYPGLKCCGGSVQGGVECGLCLVQLGQGAIALACATRVSPGLHISTESARLRALRGERLAMLAADHPLACLRCPDRDGCTREECTYGNPVEARCCAEFGVCELGKVVAYVDPGGLLLDRALVSAERKSVTEGRIRREPGLCVGCGRCVVVCESLGGAGAVLELVPAGGTRLKARSHPRPKAQPKQETLRASGCTFCGRCVLVCPTGALTAPGEAGARWLAGRREASGLAAPVLPPEPRLALTAETMAGLTGEPGVFRLFDRGGRVLRIGGVPDLQQGVAQALEEPACSSALYLMVEVDPLYTQRESELLARHAQEHGSLPPGNDLGEDLFDEEF